MRTWVDASTVIALDAIGEVALLQDLLGRITLTSEVAAEVFQGRESEALNQARGTWIQVVPTGLSSTRSPRASSPSRKVDRTWACSACCWRGWIGA